MTKHTPSDEAQLDAQIKDLLGRAVAQTPQPPELEHTMLMKANQPNKRNPWIIAGGVGLATAAAIAAFAIIPNLDDTQTVRTPANSGPATSPDPVTTAATTPTAGTGLPTETRPDPVVVVDPSEPSDSVDQVLDPATSGNPPAGPDTDFTPGIVAAGPAGISNENGVVDVTPATIAINGPDGKIWFVPSGDDADTRPRSVDTTTQEVTVVDVPTTDGHLIKLHDVAIVAGNLTLLYTTQYTQCEGLFDELCVTTLRTFQPDTGDSTLIEETTYWEAGFGEFQLADNGLIFGTSGGLVTFVPDFRNLGSGVTPTPASVGLDNSYDDCPDCPRQFTIDRSGAHIAWLDGGSADLRIVVTTLATSERVEVPIDIGESGGFVARLEISGIEIVDGAIRSGIAILSPSEPSPDFAPLGVNLDSGLVSPLSVDLVATVN